MGCCGEREKFGDLNQEQKWDYVNLDDFKSNSCWTPFAYIYLWIMMLVSISIYAVDTFTAVNLLVFDKWAGQIKPTIPFSISRWIFVGCIGLTFIFLIYRAIRAIRVIKQGGVAKSYLDPLAVRWQSIRMGKEGRGFKRFLVFAELTKSRKGADYVALFAYFSYEAWLRIVFAEGPRQVVNAMTLFSVMKLNLIPEGEHAAPEGKSPVAQFFVNIGVMADSDQLQAVVLFGMLWSLFIWLLEAISLITSIILYLLFLWHHIPSDSGGLKGYCRQKINRRMEKLVKVKVDTALKQEVELQARRDAKAARDGGGIKKQPTLPNLGDSSTDSLAPLSRQTTMTTLPEYTSRPGTARLSNETVGTAPPMPDMKGRPAGPQRVMTHTSEASWASFSSDQPLMGGAGDMGYGPTPGARTPGSTPGPWNDRPIPSRSMTGQTSYSQRSYSPAPSRPGMPQDGRNTPGTYPLVPLPRTGTGMSGMAPYPPGRSRTPSGDELPDISGRPPLPNNQSNPYFPPMPQGGFDGRNSPAPGGPRSQSRGPSDRSYPPAGPTLPRLPMSASNEFGRPPPERSFTPAEPTLPRISTANSNDFGRPPPERSYTGGSVPRPMPNLPRVQTSGNEDGGYRAFTPGPSPAPRSMTPASAGSYDPYAPNNYGRGPPPNGRQTPQSGYPRAPERQDSGLSDILGHY